MKKFIGSMSHAIAGLLHVVQSEANMRWHLLATIVVVALGVYLRINATEWSLIVGCIGAVMALECINTSIERLADRVSDQPDPLIGKCKDAAAGGVLMISIASAVIGLIVLVPKIWTLIT